jgi:phage gp29-like protein
VVRYEENIDSFRRYVTDDPTPDKMANLLRSVDEGDIAALVELTDEMVAKDLHLRGVVRTRRGAVSSLDWDIEPNPDDPDQAGAEAKADYCRTQLQDIAKFPDALKHLTTAIGPNVAVIELLWDKAEIVGVVPVPGHRLTGDPNGQKPGVFVETDTDLGVPTSPGKWIVHHPEPNAGFPFRSTLTHATVWPWLMIHFSRADWMAFSELYGHPLRASTWADTVSKEDREAAEAMLNEMSTDVAASFPADMEIQFIQAAGKGEVFVDQTAYAERKMAIGWLGQTLTTDTGQSGGGAFALGKVHEGIRSDLLAEDLMSERRTLECQLLLPMVGLRFPDQPGPSPVWVRNIEEKRDLEQEKMDLERLRAAREFGIPIKTDDVYTSLGYERPTAEDADVIGGGQATETDVNPETGDV